ncbi:uncharacterized protein BT62DRAFT_1080207 [Guyanagaster necrorhizus]|uniref:DUF7770 domain-containing protein n=1 Tax=Guyanagaster necrorhizus TaxID=856835 RepID=A0A9P7VHU9_9AGAR|nr:uncharacterized protein BT62DRAFT_1080207 [Guyanagaster necrorhizus MCA 3950]KAG7441331.1 hypothetical protein BT62DRAFT_1080207 [Guyanagaster necrorhizus MCA 3950]
MSELNFDQSGFTSIGFMTLYLMYNHYINPSFPIVDSLDLQQVRATSSRLFPADYKFTAIMSYALPNRTSIQSTPNLQAHLATLEVDGIAIVGTSNGHIYHFRAFIYNRALDCSVSFDCNPTYEALDPDRARVAVDFKTYLWAKSQNTSPGQIPPSTGAFEVKLQTSTKVWKICNVVFNTLKRDQYRFNGGMGCRHWCAIILGDLEVYGYVPRGTTVQFEAWEQAKCREVGVAAFIHPRVEGAFYN